MHRRFFILPAALLATTAVFAGSPAWARPHQLSLSQAYAAYAAAIRYFNPSVDETEARQIVAAILRESWDAHVDPRLVVAVVATESSFDPTARSSAGARGLGQLMPSTAALDNVTDVENIDQNIRGTVLTLRGDIDHYAGWPPQEQYVRAIAAYNAGTGAVDRYGDVPPYDETVNYVYKVIGLWRKLTGMD
jgi:soluble lytic murein transglycosylase-like protein